MAIKIYLLFSGMITTRSEFGLFKLKTKGLKLTSKSETVGVTHPVTTLGQELHKSMLPFQEKYATSSKRLREFETDSTHKVILSQFTGGWQRIYLEMEESNVKCHTRGEACKIKTSGVGYASDIEGIRHTKQHRRSTIEESVKQFNQRS